LTVQAIPYVTLLAFLFGSTLVASRFSVGQFAPATYVSLRLILASFCHLAIYALLRRQHFPRGRQLWRHAAVLGVFGTAIPMTAIVTSLQFQSSGITAVLITISPAITILMANFLLPEESLTLRKGIGALLALSGALLLALLGESGLPDVSRANPIGYLLVLTAMILASATTIYARKYMRDLDTFDVASARMIIAALVVAPLTLLFVGYDLSEVTAEGYMALIYASLIGTFAGTLLAFYNIQRFGATAAAVTGYLIPLVATAGGLLILDETITIGMAVGIGIIVAGVALLNQKPRRVDSEVRTLSS
jgi:drug/metabolite transporter (DMT)-like permease